MTLIQPLDWKLGNFLEWRTHLPYVNQPQISPVFVIKNIDCYFQLSRNSGFYNLYLKPKSKCTKLEPFSLTMYLEYCEQGYIYLKKGKFSDWNAYFFSFSDNYFKDCSADLDHGFTVKFLFILEQNVGLSEKKVDEKSLQTDEKMSEMDQKSTQADAMMSLQTDVEVFSIDFGELLKTGDHSDVQLLCNGGNIPAHKAILSARSKTFSDMLQDNSEENKNGFINLTTTEKAAMELCLEFIYTGKILNLPVDKASNLYVLGHILKISSLTRKCADLLVFNLCEDNYISYLVLADKYDDNYFKRGLIDYISDHIKLLKNESWIKFSDEYMKTAIEVYKICMLKLI